MTNIRWAAIPVLAATMLGAAACGSGNSGASASPPPSKTLVNEVKTALQHARSVHVTGTINDKGRRIGMNLSLTRAGGLSGQLSTNGAGFSVLSTGGSAYIKLTGAFLRYAHLPTAACSLMCGKYLKVPASEAGSLTGSLSMTSLLNDADKNPGNVHNAGTATVNGQRAWILKGSDGTTAYVAAQGTPYLLRLVPQHAKQGRLDFTQWNNVTIPPPPPSDQVVDLSKLTG
jgi:hypothetical protein